MKNLFLFLFISIPLYSQVRMVSEHSSVKINNVRYAECSLTYYVDEVKMDKFSIKKLDEFTEKANKLEVRYLDNGKKRTKTFLGKMPKVIKEKEWNSQGKPEDSIISPIPKD
ncbi:hypothetical protein [Neomegalonema sp.]|uniref:hypothetical protein n=1 Tax=Neomegalonema sp. TaxID=2039713 RepID=UPI0026249777|nr:hypothetical protein [Neomegalonema sp.]MDD2869671.1 hypothetical protein [Neomegalonema sp.]